jgi:excinuclease ABC subunit C
VHVPPEIKNKLRELPNKPGVYLFRDRLGRVIYVGKARSLRRRVSQYFHPSRQLKFDLKTRALIDGIRDFETFVVRSEPEALLLEGKLIKEYKPRYNVSFRDDKRFLLVKVDMREPWPRFRFARLKKDDGARYFGPFVHGSAVRQTMNYLRKQYGILMFGTGNPTERELKYSSYQVPAKLSDLTPQQYRERVEKACEILEGKVRDQLTELEAQMKKAAFCQQYEKAAQLRDLAASLREVAKKTRKFERLAPTAMRRPFDLQQEMAQLQQALGLPTLPRHIEGFDISNIGGTLSVASEVCFVDGKPHKDHYRHFRIKTVKGADDFASIAEVVARRYARLLQEGGKLPDLILIDGGAGQLRAAQRALWKLGLKDQPVIGLAKKLEEIYLPATCPKTGSASLPLANSNESFKNASETLALPTQNIIGGFKVLQLSSDSAALHLLQRLRDEAHRFANQYHQKLRRRRIQESVLDEFPGIGENRKKLLLRHFGSIQRLRAASVEQIAQLQGIGKKLAEALTKFLGAEQSDSHRKSAA